VHAPPPASSAVEDYLKAVYALETRLEGPVPTNALAERLGVTPGSVSGMLRRLDELGLLEHERYRGVTLTSEGRRIALRTLRSDFVMRGERYDSHVLSLVGAEIDAVS
jgi:DtxR family Mn-dependent transcriptional regulator